MALEAPQEDAVCISEGHLRSRGPSGPPRSGKSGKNGAPQEDPVCISEGHLRSRGPNGLPRSGKSGKTAPPLSRRRVTDRCALLGEHPVRAET